LQSFSSGIFFILLNDVHFVAALISPLFITRIIRLLNAVLLHIFIASIKKGLPYLMALALTHALAFGQLVM